METWLVNKFVCVFYMWKHQEASFFYYCSCVFIYIYIYSYVNLFFCFFLQLFHFIILPSCIYLLFYRSQRLIGPFSLIWITHKHSAYYECLFFYCKSLTDYPDGSSVSLHSNLPTSPTWCLQTKSAFHLWVHRSNCALIRSLPVTLSPLKVS